MKRKELLVILLISIMLTLMIGCTTSAPPLQYGSIDVNSTPTGAKVYINGIETGMVTPIVFTKEVGNYSVKLDKFYYEIWEGTVTVNADQTTYINAPLTPASIETITLQPGSEGKDSAVVETLPDNNYGSLTYFYTGSTILNQKYRAYLQFDLSTIPTNARIIDAYSMLYQINSLGTGNFIVGLYQVTSDWEEGTITWNNQPTSSTVLEASCTVYAAVPAAWRTWYNIGDLVQGWLDGSITNQGILLNSTDEASLTMIAVFCSSDYTTDTSKRPKLTINYYIP